MFFLCVCCVWVTEACAHIKSNFFIVIERQLKLEEEEVEYCQLTTNRKNFPFAMFERGKGTTGK